MALGPSWRAFGLLWGSTSEHLSARAAAPPCQPPILRHLPLPPLLSLTIFLFKAPLFFVAYFVDLSYFPPPFLCPTFNGGTPKKTHNSLFFYFTRQTSIPTPPVLSFSYFTCLLVGGFEHNKERAIKTCFS